jgi:hypothetical protein
MSTAVAWYAFIEERGPVPVRMADGELALEYARSLYGDGVVRVEWVAFARWEVWLERRDPTPLAGASLAVALQTGQALHGARLVRVQSVGSYEVSQREVI